VIIGWKKLEPIVILMGTFFNITNFLSFSFYMSDEFIDEWFTWGGKVLNLQIIVIYLVINVVLSILIAIWKRKNVSEITTDLDILYLNDMYLSSVPENIGLLDDIKEIHLENNFITRLPKSICKLPPSTKINLENNPLEEIPSCLDCDENLTVCNVKI
jgi:hypothetical protein